MIKEALFVYGTLKPNCENEHVLKEIEGKFTKAMLKGFTFDDEWQKQTGYPGIRETNLNSEVKGFLFTSTNLINNWKVLDKFETEAYHRINVPVILTDKSIVNAYVYTINNNFDICKF
ncbi:gamma-glutamylcyclotransferase family protein [uncultured Polaribacter sp.]|uniref:gamma-glutamylcyclotransferase family protein n=1 Tax=uncultured Polaribacter sp. TaxID=174711 RepID=UPI00261F9803|nr:gamma-glutamylcyclotransferase family protein [uncultured Polaribacter sp.]